MENIKDFLQGLKIIIVSGIIISALFLPMLLLVKLDNCNYLFLYTPLVVIIIKQLGEDYRNMKEKFNKPRKPRTP